MEMKILNEAYYGKNQVLVECEELMTIALKNPNKRTDSIMQIQTKLEELFNFKKLVITYTVGLMAASIPISIYKLRSLSTTIELIKNAETGGVQFRTEDKVEALVMIDIGVLAISKMNGEEVMAVILHEIGHSMVCVLPFAKIQLGVTAIGMCLTIIPGLLINKLSLGVLKLTEFIDRIMPDYIKNIFSTLIHISSKYFSRLERSKEIIESIKAMIKSKSMKDYIADIKDTNLDILKKPETYFKLFMLPFGYRNEQLSDIISTSYGYGPTLISALGKLRNYEDIIIYDNPIMRLYKLPLNIVNTALDPHPENVTRMLMIIKKLEDDLKNTVSKDAYSMIQEDIGAAKLALEDYKKSISNKKIQNIDIIIYQKIVDKLFDGNTDIRALFFGLRKRDLAKLEMIDTLPVNTPTLTEDSSLTECASIYNCLLCYAKDDRDKLIKFLSE